MLIFSIIVILGILYRMFKKEQEQWRLNRAIQNRRWNNSDNEF